MKFESSHFGFVLLQVGHRLLPLILITPIHVGRQGAQGPEAAAEEKESQGNGAVRYFITSF